MIEFLPQPVQTRVTASTRIRRTRRLPIPGEVSGAIGMRIGAQDIIARAYPPKMRRALSLTRVIGVTEAEVPKRLLKHVGDPVEAREIIIARPINFGVQRLVYRAPEAGQITAIQGSWMILDIYGQSYDVPALYRGTMVAVEPRRGGILEAQGALVQGVWGSSASGDAVKEVVGVIKWLDKAQDSVLEPESIEADARGAIVIASGGVTEAALERAVQMQVGGLVVGSLLPELRRSAMACKFPVMVTEGFGSKPMSTPVYDLLTVLNGQEAALNGRYAPRGADAIRPELFVPLAASRMLASDVPAEMEHLEVTARARVRGLCEPYLGRIGTLPDEFWLEWMSTDAGTFLPAVKVEWQNSPGEKQTVPWTNLELIG
jgi:hypothetical protein